MKVWCRLIPAVVGAACLSATASGQQLEGNPARVSLRTQTYAQLFQSSMRVGPQGSLVSVQTHAPVTQYVFVQGEAVDSLFGPDSVSLEMAGWNSLNLTSQGPAPDYQADVQTASVTISAGSRETQGWVRLGRQVWAGGAARFARFDGGSGRIFLGPEFSIGAYGGLSVLPRWDARPGYYHLGSAADGLLDDPGAFEAPQREQFTVFGGNVVYQKEVTSVVLSVHEQRETTGVSRRNLGLDAHTRLLDAANAGGALLVELDSLRLATARLFVDVDFRDDLSGSFEYLKAEPALLLSRQSVLSVFGADGYHEAGGVLSYDVVPRLQIDATGFMQFYDGAFPGSRLGADVRYSDPRVQDALVLTAGYFRVDTQESGYHSLRAALGASLFPDLRATLQGFYYFYDEAIQGYKTSFSHAVTADYRWTERWSLLLSGVLSSSPYAALDASTQLRLTYDLEGREARW